MPRDRTGCCVLCPGKPPEPRAFLDAIVVCGRLLDQGCPPELVPELLCEFERSRLVYSRAAIVTNAMRRRSLVRRMAAGIA